VRHPRLTRNVLMLYLAHKRHTAAWRASARGLCSGHCFCLQRGRRRTRAVVVDEWHSHISNVTHPTPSPSHTQGVDTPISLTLEATCELATEGGTPATSPSCRSGGRATPHATTRAAGDFFLSCSPALIPSRIEERTCKLLHFFSTSTNASLTCPTNVPSTLIFAQNR
jgi:hypothetical protein